MLNSGPDCLSIWHDVGWTRRVCPVHDLTGGFPVLRCNVFDVVAIHNQPLGCTLMKDSAMVAVVEKCARPRTLNPEAFNAVPRAFLNKE